MSKFFIVNLIDRLFVTVCVFLTIFAWINFYTRNLWISFVLGLIFSFACVFLIYFFSTKKQEKKQLTKSKMEKIDKYFLAFKIMTTTEQINFFRAILKQEDNFEIRNEIITYNQNEKSCAIIFATDFPILTENDFLNIVKTTKNLDASKIQIVCNSFENFNTKILNNKEYALINRQKLFSDFFEKHEIYPNTDNISEKTNRLKFIEILSNFFVPHKAKSYFVCGLILIFSSVILPYNTYYIIFGSILLIFAIICKLKKIIFD